MRSILVLFLILFSAKASSDTVVLKPEDQPYYKNERFSGMNKLQRIDSLVIEVNKVHGELAALKSEMALLKEEVEKLKAKK